MKWKPVRNGYNSVPYGYCLRRTTRGNWRAWWSTGFTLPEQLGTHPTLRQAVEACEARREAEELSSEA